jgi:hypothetical protein
VDSGGVLSDQLTLVAWLTDHPGTSVDDAQKALNWTKPQLAKAMTDDARRLAVRHRTGSSRKWSEDEILDALRQAWVQVSGSTDALSYAKYSELVSGKQIDGPTAVRVLQVFGSWAEAAERAGVPAGKKPNRTFTSAWTDEQILEDVRRYLADPSTRGSFAGWDAWKKANAPQAPSGAMIRNRLGNWSDIKARVLGE